VDAPRVKAMNNTYERALVTMHKMPRVWLDYLEHLMQQFLVTQTRRAFDRALCSLPITQHDRIWQLYLVRMCWGSRLQDNVSRTPAGSASALLCQALATSVQRWWRSC